MQIKTENLSSAIYYCQLVLEERLKHHFADKTDGGGLGIDPFILDKDDGSEFTKTVFELKLTNAELLILILGLMPNIFPGYLDEVLKKHLTKDTHFALFGGKKSSNHRGILPTVETAIFILGGNNLPDRIRSYQLFLPESKLISSGIIQLEQVHSPDPWTSGVIVVAKRYVDLFIFDRDLDQPYSTFFPAKKINTKLDWKDLILDERTHILIRELLAWINHHKEMQNLTIAKHLKPGYRALFHGPSGTGKTLTACLLGKSTGKDVYRVDLSMVVSKFIGETEKNLSSLFTQAENRDWILFFDEADALFGKRTNVKDAHDRYANQEVAYLLQRIEDYNGLVILASNFKENMDDAFTRRFQAIISFHIPNEKERLLLWEKILPTEIPLAKEIDLQKIAQHYELSGASIVNIVEHCSLLALMGNLSFIDNSLLIKCIRREYLKEGRRI